jgi:hypothetical protein
MGRGHAPPDPRVACVIDDVTELATTGFLPASGCVVVAVTTVDAHREHRSGCGGRTRTGGDVPRLARGSARHGAGQRAAGGVPAAGGAGGWSPGAVTVTRGRLKHARLLLPEMLQLTSSQPLSLASSRYRLISPVFPTTEQKWSHFGTNAPRGSGGGCAPTAPEPYEVVTQPVQRPNSRSAIPFMRRR